MGDGEAGGAGAADPGVGAGAGARAGVGAGAEAGVGAGAGAGVEGADRYGLGLPLRLAQEVALPAAALSGQLAAVQVLLVRGRLRHYNIYGV